MRVPRMLVPGAVHHVISRLVDGRWLIDSDAVRRRYLALVDRAFARSDWTWIGYGVMSNHVHHVAVAGLAPAEGWLKRAHAPFGNWLNEQNGGLGHVFAQRPSIYVVAPRDVARVVAYVHNNPVRATVCARASGASPLWTSHHAYLTGETPFRSLHVVEGLRRCGFDDSATNRDAFDSFVAQSAEDEGIRVDLRRVRREARRYGQLEVGTPLVDGEVSVPLLSRPATYFKMSIDPEELLAVVANTLGLTMDVLTGRGQPSVHARRVALIVGRAHGLSMATVARAMGISPQAGSKLLSQPERVRACVGDATKVAGTIEALGLMKLKPSPSKVLEPRGRKLMKLKPSL